MADGSGSTNRFTLTDYEYDRDANARAVSRSVRLTQEEGLENRDMANATASSSRGTAGGRALPTGSGSYENEDGDTLAKGKSTSSNGSTGQRSDKGRLRLHQPTERPVYPPKPNTITSAQMVTSPVESMSAMSHISSSGSGVLHAYPRSASTRSQLSQAGPSSPSTSAIRPLPPLPRSFSSSTSITSPLSPTAAQSLPQTPSRSHPMSPPLSEFNDSLTPRLADHRPVSDAWSSQDVEVKEKGESQEDYFSSRPALVTRPSGTDKVLTVWQKFFPASWPCRLLLLTVILETLIDITIEGNILWRFNAEVDSGSASYLRVENSRRLPVYLVIYGLAHLWQLVLTFVAVRSRNTVQVVAVTAFNFAFLGYAVIQIYELRQLLNGDLEGGLTSGVNENDPTLLTLPLNVLTAVVIGVVAGGCVALVILSYFIRKEFGWQRYRFLGADLQIRKLYLRFQVYECICYFSAFFCAGFGIQFIWLVLQKTDVEYIITWIAFPLLILLLVMGRFAAKYENKPSMAIFMLGLVAGCAYFIFKLVRIWQQETTTYYTLTKSLTVFDALSIASLSSCFVYGVLVWKDFGKGLKEAVLEQHKASSLHSVAGLWGTKSKDVESPQVELDMAKRRISID